MAIGLPAPSHLSHYTTLEGAKGIITSKCLWASNVSFLNDRSELLHALEASSAAVEALVSNKKLKRILPVLREVIQELENGKIPDTFAVCFCKDDDNLSQWRGYSHDQQGVCITFDRKTLYKRLANDGAHLQSVLYTDKSTRRKFKEELENKLVELQDLNNVLGSQDEQVIYQSVYNAVSELLPIFKHLGFKDEREWRFVFQQVQPDSKLDFRVADYRIVPYIKVGHSKDPLPIRSIRVGPGPHQDLTLQSFKPLLDAQNYRRVDLLKSMVPYRV